MLRQLVPLVREGMLFELYLPPSSGYRQEALQLLMSERGKKGKGGASKYQVRLYRCTRSAGSFGEPTTLHQPRTLTPTLTPPPTPTS